MNAVILLAMKWLKDPKSVSREELSEARMLANDAFYAAPSGNKEAEYYALLVIDGAVDEESKETRKYIDEYFKVTGESREEYEKELVR